METKNRIYQLYELRDEMRKAVLNSKLVEENEKALVSIILKSDKADEFKDFVNSISKNWPDYELQRNNMNTKIKKIDYIVSLHEKKDEQAKLVDNIVSLVLEILDAVAPEKSKKNKK